MVDRNLEDRFWSKVDTSGDCWEWQGARLKSGGYGVISRSRADGQIRAHRLSYEIANGPFDQSLHVRHKCDNPPCVNPDHLELGTHAENMQDVSDRNRRKKSHCKRGHELNSQNAYTNKAGHKYCKICKAENSRKKLREVRGDMFGVPTHAKRTHCKFGHEYNEENTYTRPDGYKECRACRKDRVKKFKENQQ